MAHTPVCLVCKKEMELGFMAQPGVPGANNLPHWCAGTPEKNIFGGDSKRSALEQGVRVVAYRCPECEALRLYAPRA